MNEQVLSKRLSLVGQEVPVGARLADIGSDHAYLPVALMLAGKLEYAVAGEVVKGPFESAKNQVAKNGLDEKIVVRLADGLAAVKTSDQIDTVTIAGMGGTLIASILEAGKVNKQLTGMERLVLQPNVGEPQVRHWLMENGYQIEKEHILEENGKLYEIIVAEPVKNADGVRYSEEELFFGPFLMKTQSPEFIKKWRHEAEQIRRVLLQLQKASSPQEEKVSTLTAELARIEAILGK
ncbi:tRNA (adenine(22)-N(1))-methyltransferase TrmK [Enterococcus asini]|uniref:tRNA (adenine(22)-N(1))-methyltransferase n=1 Tax=Enterococcus asini TaxID=57732 RepID=UPI00288CD61A|nr:tRNA (adenine(22)-N(1))-methyltransferase TrmK [Enterococcus asini]MDT2756930.1 tRNA (adenine(22)-N(1))-methyltransferase TrmK [Enterococcus asini]